VTAERFALTRANHSLQSITKRWQIIGNGQHCVVGGEQQVIVNKNLEINHMLFSEGYLSFQAATLHANMHQFFSKRLGIKQHIS